MRISNHLAMIAILWTPVVATDVYAQESPSELALKIVGTWALSEQWVEQVGKKIERFGAHPKGIAMYDANGRFATILLRTDLPKFASNNAMTGTADEYKAVVQGSNASYGTWSVDQQDGTLISKIEGSTFPGWDGQNQRRTLTIAGEEMKMCVSGAQIGGTACATWKRAK